MALKLYAYDSIGNITLKRWINIHVFRWQVLMHAVTSLSDGSVFKYDTNGNMVSLQKGQ